MPISSVYTDLPVSIYMNGPGVTRPLPTPGGARLTPPSMYVLSPARALQVRGTVATVSRAAPGLVRILVQQYLERTGFFGTRIAPPSSYTTMLPPSVERHATMLPLYTMSAFLGSTLTSAKSEPRLWTRASVLTLRQLAPASSLR